MSSSSGGVSTGTVIFIVFFILKLCHVINWSWIWIFAPIWIPLLLIGIVFFIVWSSICISDYLKSRRITKQMLADSEIRLRESNMLEKKL